jgi:hypothetical protein
MIGNPTNTIYHSFGNPLVGAIIKSPIPDSRTPTVSIIFLSYFLQSNGTKLIKTIYETVRAPISRDALSSYI